MSRKKRAIEKQKKQNSPKRKAKQAKKAYYSSWDAHDTWEEKKARKEQGRLTKRVSKGISVECPLRSWEQPSIENCSGCKLNCSSDYQ